MKKSHKYPFSLKVVEYEPNDTEFEVAFNDFPSVVGAGDTPEEAIKEAYQNLEIFIEDCEEHSIPLPNPSKTNYLDEYSGKITIRLPKTLHRDLSEYAKRDGMSLNAIAIEAIRFYLSSSSMENLTTHIKEQINLYLEDIMKANDDGIQYLYSQKFFANSGEFELPYSIKKGAWDHA
ncbi:MAG TPA: type II toxin-antitoxin system HicB family antitoxin [Bacilli bacterium]|nr:type II toxin-antitoxin system HicB family antitoxin [Bacilli bacterium]